MSNPTPYQMRVNSIIDHAWDEVPDFTREEILELRDQNAKGDELSRELFLPLWNRYVAPKLDAFYESDEGKILWKDWNEEDD